ncbi:MAG: class I SAM-dependent methyltransferase [Terricaulis sp.]
MSATNSHEPANTAVDAPEPDSDASHSVPVEALEPSVLEHTQTVAKAEPARRSELQEAMRSGYVEPFPGATFDWFLDYAQPQTMMFYMDLVPYLNHLLAKLQYGLTLSVLDAGCGSGAGAELLGSLHRSTFLGHRYDMTGIDLYDTYKRYADQAYLNMKYQIGDIHEMEAQSFDVVICSHVIEHFNDPTAFMKQLQNISRYFALFYCPLNEVKLLDEGRGHLRSIDPAFVEGFDPAFVEVRQSLAWRHPDDARSDCVVFALPGARWAELQRQRRIDWSGTRALSVRVGES